MKSGEKKTAPVRRAFLTIRKTPCDDACETIWRATTAEQQSLRSVALPGVTHVFVHRCISFPAPTTFAIHTRRRNRLSIGHVFGKPAVSPARAGVPQSPSAADHSPPRGRRTPRQVFCDQTFVVDLNPPPPNLPERWAPDSTRAVRVLVDSPKTLCSDVHSGGAPTRKTVLYNHFFIIFRRVCFVFLSLLNHVIPTAAHTYTVASL